MTSRAEFYDCYRALRRHASEEARSGYRVAFPEQYYESKCGPAIKALSDRRYAKNLREPGRFSTSEKQNFEKMLKVFFPG